MQEDGQPAVVETDIKKSPKSPVAKGIVTPPKTPPTPQAVKAPEAAKEPAKAPGAKAPEMAKEPVKAPAAKVPAEKVPVVKVPVQQEQAPQQPDPNLPAPQHQDPAANSANAANAQTQKDLQGNLGMGVNTLNGRFTKIALNMNNATIIKEPLNNTTVEMKTVESASSLRREISGSGSVAATVGPNVNVGLEFAGSHDVKFNALATHYVIKVKTSRYKLSLTQGYDLHDDVKSMLNQQGEIEDGPHDNNAPAQPVVMTDAQLKKNNGMVFDQFGNACVTSLTYGHEIIFVVQVNNTSHQTTNSTKTTASATVPNMVKVEGSLSTLLDSLNSENVLNISVHSRGIDSTEFDAKSLDGMKKFLSSVSGVKSLLSNGNNGGSDSTKDAKDDAASNKNKNSDKPAAESKPQPGATSSAATSPTSGVVININPAAANIASSKPEPSDKPNTTTQDTTTKPAAVPVEWDAVLDFDTKPFFAISKGMGALRTKCRSYDDKFLPFKNISAKILECYDRIDAFLQLIECTDRNPALCQAGQNKMYRRNLQGKKDWLETAKHQLYLKLLNIYKNPFEQDSKWLAASVNSVVAQLNTFSSKSLKFNEGLILLKERTKASPTRSHYFHEFLIPVEIGKFYFDIIYLNKKGQRVKLAGVNPENLIELPYNEDVKEDGILFSEDGQEVVEFTPRFKVRRRGLYDFAVFERVTAGSYIDTAALQNQKKIENAQKHQKMAQKALKAPTLYVCEFEPNIPNDREYIVQVWGKLTADFLPLMELSGDQLSLEVANAPLDDAGRAEVWEKANAAANVSQTHFWKLPPLKPARDLKQVEKELKEEMLTDEVRANLTQRVAAIKQLQQDRIEHKGKTLNELREEYQVLKAIPDRFREEEERLQRIERSINDMEREQERWHQQDEAERVVSTGLTRLLLKK